MTGPRPLSVGDLKLGAPALMTLAVWLSPAFPIGGFAYSQGLEQAIADGAVGDAETTRNWLETVIRQGAGRADIVLLARAQAAAAAADWDAVADLAALAESLSPSAERHLETMTLGAAFDRAVAAVWPSPATTAAALDGARLAYPIAVGAHAGALGLPPGPLALLFAQNAASTLVSAAVRLVPLGQTNGLRIVEGLRPAITETVADALAAADAADPEDLVDALAGCAFGADIAAMRHETLQTRIFRT